MQDKRKTLHKAGGVEAEERFDDRATQIVVHRRIFGIYDHFVSVEVTLVVTDANSIGEILFFLIFFIPYCEGLWGNSQKGIALHKRIFKYGV